MRKPEVRPVLTQTGTTARLHHVEISEDDTFEFSSKINVAPEHIPELIAKLQALAGAVRELGGGGART